MDIIDSYAMRLTDTMGGDAEEAYAIALDAFVRGNTILTAANLVRKEHISSLILFRDRQVLSSATKR